MIGYSLSTVHKNKQADIKKSGVRIGRKCIKLGIPVSTIAKVAGVSTVAVYGWFAGDFNPKQKIADKVFAYLEKQ
jgi:hypothetical protein